MKVLIQNLKLPCCVSHYNFSIILETGIVKRKRLGYWTVSECIVYHNSPAGHNSFWSNWLDSFVQFFFPAKIGRENSELLSVGRHSSVPNIARTLSEYQVSCPALFIPIRTQYNTLFVVFKNKWMFSGWFRAKACENGDLPAKNWSYFGRSVNHIFKYNLVILSYFMDFCRNSIKYIVKYEPSRK